jgi:hypothetical protein
MARLAGGPTRSRMTPPKARGVNATASAFLHDQDPQRTQDEVHSFDHLVRADEQRGWHLDA